MEELKTKNGYCKRPEFRVRLKYSGGFGSELKSHRDHQYHI